MSRAQESNRGPGAHIRFPLLYIVDQQQQTADVAKRYGDVCVSVCVVRVHMPGPDYFDKVPQTRIRTGVNDTAYRS